MKKLSWIIVLILILLGFAITPLTLFKAEHKRLDLYFESSRAEAPVSISFSYFPGREDTITGLLHGLQSGFRDLTGHMTLEIGPQYRGWSPISWAHYKKGAFIPGFGEWDRRDLFAIYGNFTVPASELVPYMIQELDQEGNPIDPQTGSLSFSVAYHFEVSGASRPFQGEYRGGSVQIRIVGDLTEYVEEELEEGIDYQPGSEEEPGLDESSHTGDTGASNLSSELRGLGFSLALSIPLLLIIVVIVLVIARKG